MVRLIPSLFSVARNARALGYLTAIDQAVLKPVEDHFNFIAKREGFALGEPREYDSYHYRHQVPGGMISNFRFQLGKLGMAHRVGEVLEETAQVRRGVGLPDHGDAVLAVRRRAGGDERHSRRALQGSYRRIDSLRARQLG